MEITTIPVSALTQNGPAPVKDVFSTFIESRDVKPSSRKLYNWTLTQFIHWMKENAFTFDSLTRTEIIKYKQDLIDSGHSPLTVSSYLTVVREFYSFTEANRIYPNVAKDIKPPKRRAIFERETLTEAESRRLNNWANESKCIRDYAIISLLQHTGLRTIELVRANIEDITIRNGKRVLLVHGKGRDAKDQEVILTDEVYSVLSAYLNGRVRTKISEPLFLSFSNRNAGQRLTTRFISGLVKEGMRAIGLDDRRYTAHSLRHTVGTMLYAKTGQIDAVRIALRHSSTVTSEIYARKAIRNAAIENSPLELLAGVFNSMYTVNSFNTDSVII